jgi:hypothetical protein
VSSSSRCGCGRARTAGGRTAGRLGGWAAGRLGGWVVGSIARAHILEEQNVRVATILRVHPLSRHRLGERVEHGLRARSRLRVDARRLVSSPCDGTLGSPAHEVEVDRRQAVYRCGGGRRCLGEDFEVGDGRLAEDCVVGLRAGGSAFGADERRAGGKWSILTLESALLLLRNCSTTTVDASAVKTMPSVTSPSVLRASGNETAGHLSGEFCAAGAARAEGLVPTF